MKQKKDVQVKKKKKRLYVLKEEEKKCVVQRDGKKWRKSWKNVYENQSCIKRINGMKKKIKEKWKVWKIGKKWYKLGSKIIEITMVWQKIIVSKK